MVNIVVVGSLNMDVLISVNPYPLPGETVIGGSVQYNPGGKGANQAFAAARLGANVTMLGMIGRDSHGDTLRHMLSNANIDTTYVQTCDAPTGQAFVHVEADGTNRIILAPGANAEFSKEKLATFEPLIQAADAVLVQLEIPIETVSEVTHLAAKHDVPVFLDPAPARADLFQYISDVTWVTPNEHEAERLVGHAIRDEASAQSAALKLQSLGAKRVLLKVGARGAYVLNHDTWTHQSAFTVTAVDTTAAGDACNAGFVVDYLMHRDIRQALRTACAAGALTTTKMGAQSSLPSRQDVEVFLNKLL